MSLRGWELQGSKGTVPKGEGVVEEAAGLPAECPQESNQWHSLLRDWPPLIRQPVTHAITAGLRLGGAGSCLTMGETMAGWGIPEVGRPGWAGATM